MPKQKQNIMRKVMYFLLGIGLVVLTSATTVSVMTVKPATPKSVVTLVGDVNEMSRQILKHSKNGYVIKFATQSQGEYGGYEKTRCLVVMEKY